MGEYLPSTPIAANLFANTIRAGHFETIIGMYALEYAYCAELPRNITKDRKLPILHSIPFHNMFPQLIVVCVCILYVH